MRLKHLSAPVRRTASFIRRYNPFALTGLVLFGVAIYLLGTGFATGNSYAFLLSTVLLGILLVFAVVVRLEARRARGYEFAWDGSGYLRAREEKPSQAMVHSGYRPLPFLRAHGVLRGEYAVGRNTRFYVVRNVPFDEGPRKMIPLYLPFAGTVHGHFHAEIRDVFGLARAPFGEEQELALEIQPGTVAQKEPPRIEAQQGDENQNRMRSSDIERYFMREYIPGDRERDINWKASSRYFQLFTRISPVTQEKTQLVTVFFRPYTSKKRDSLEAIVLLDRAKSMLMFFLRSVRAMHPEYEFRLYIGNDLVELESDDDVEQLASDIAAVHYRSFGSSGRIEVSEVSSGAFVFSTACDTGLNEFIGRFAENTADVYISRSAGPGDEETVRINLFDEVDSILPEIILVPRTRDTRRVPPVSSQQHITEEAMEVRFASR